MNILIESFVLLNEMFLVWFFMFELFAILCHSTNMVIKQTKENSFLLKKINRDKEDKTWVDSIRFYLKNKSCNRLSIRKYKTRKQTEYVWVHFHQIVNVFCTVLEYVYCLHVWPIRTSSHRIGYLDMFKCTESKKTFVFLFLQHVWRWNRK